MRVRWCGWEMNARRVVRYCYAYEFENHIGPLRPFSLRSSIYWESLHLTNVKAATVNLISHSASTSFH